MIRIKFNFIILEVKATVMHEAKQLRRRVIRGLLTSVYHGDQGVAGLLLLKHRILLGVLKKWHI